MFHEGTVGIKVACIGPCCCGSVGFGVYGVGYSVIMH